VDTTDFAGRELPQADELKTRETWNRPTLRCLAASQSEIHTNVTPDLEGTS